MNVAPPTVAASTEPARSAASRSADPPTVSMRHARRIDSELFQRNPGRHFVRTSHGTDADFFARKIRRLVDRLARHERVVQAIHRHGHNDHIFACRSRRNRPRGPGNTELNFAGNQRLYDSYISLNVSNLGIDTLVSENSFLSSNPQRRKINDDAGNRDTNFSQRFGCQSKPMRN